VKRLIHRTVSSIGLGLALTIGILASSTPDVSAQAVPSPSPSPAASPAANPAATTPAPRAGGFPMELAWPMLAGGAAAVGAGAVLLRRGRT
jgi:hypothetical protein